MITPRYRVRTWDGESPTLYYVVDLTAPEPEQPAVIATFTDKTDANRIAVIMNGLHAQIAERAIDTIAPYLDRHNRPEAPRAETPRTPPMLRWYQIPLSTGLVCLSLIVSACSVLYATAGIAAVDRLARARTHALPTTGAPMTLPAGHALQLEYHARTRYVLTEIGTDGDTAPVLSTWTINVEPMR